MNTAVSPPGRNATERMFGERRIPILSNALIKAELGWPTTCTTEQGMQAYLGRLKALKA